MNKYAVLAASALLLFLGACSSDPEEGDPSSPGMGSATTPPTSQTEKDADAPPLSLSSVGSPLNAPTLSVLDLNVSSFSLTWETPSNWLPTNKPGPVYKLRIAKNPDFSDVFFTHEYVAENNASFHGLAPGTTHHLSLTASPPQGDDRFLPGSPAIVTIATRSHEANEPGGIVVTPTYGAVTIEWPEVESKGPIAYNVGIFEDAETTNLVREFVTTETSLRNIPLPSQRTYWMRFLYGPTGDNTLDQASLPYETQFFVPANELATPAKLVAQVEDEDVRVSWDPIDNNLGPFHYRLDVYVGESLTDTYANFQLNQTTRLLEDSKSYGTFNFELHAEPAEGNFKDVAGQINSLRFDMPVTSYSPPTSPALAPSPEEPTILVASWTAAVETGPGLRYEIEIAEDGNYTTLADVRIAPAEATETDFTGREPGKTYHLRIRSLGPDGDATVLPSAWTPDATYSMPAPPPIPEFNATEEKASP